MSRLERKSLEMTEVKRRLQGIVSDNYVWPEEPAGWWLEFIAYPGGEVVMDLLHPVSGAWWSDENDMLAQPALLSGELLDAKVLQNAGIPFMGTFQVAGVEEKDGKPHLSIVEKDS